MKGVTMTKNDFLRAYEAEVLKAYAWATDTDRRHKFMLSVRATLRGPATTWSFDGPATREAWRAIGGKGKPTLKALRALEDA